MMTQAVFSVDSSAGLGDLRGSLSSRLDYGPFDRSSPHAYSAMLSDAVPLIRHPELDDDERLAIAAMLCTFAATAEGRILLDKPHILDLVSGLCTAVLSKMSGPNSSSGTLLQVAIAVFRL